MFRDHSRLKFMKREDSLKRKKEFRYTYRAGKSCGGHYAVMIYARSRDPKPRVGFSISKKIGNAVVRNRTKRRMREAITPLLPLLKPNINIIFIARSPIVEAPFLSIRKGMERSLNSAGLLTGQPTE